VPGACASPGKSSALRILNVRRLWSDLKSKFEKRAFFRKFVSEPGFPLFFKISKSWLLEPPIGRGTPRKCSNMYPGLARAPGSPAHFEFWMCDGYGVIWSPQLKTGAFFVENTESGGDPILSIFWFSTSTLMVSRIFQKHQASYFTSSEGFFRLGGVQRTSNEDLLTLRFQNQSQHLDVEKFSKVATFRRRKFPTTVRLLKMTTFFGDHDIIEKYTCDAIRRCKTYLQTLKFLQNKNLWR